MEKIQKQSRHYSIPEFYRIYCQSMVSVRYFSASKRKGELERRFIERIMLAVTEVNGCALCSYAHTKMALKTGMNN